MRTDPPSIRPRRAVARTLVIVSTVLGLGLTACDTGTTTRPSAVDAPATVPLGAVPEAVSNQPPPPPPPTAQTITVTTIDSLEPIVGEITGYVAGNRVLLIGDAVLAATAPRNDGTMCDGLTGFGWTVEIDAEPGRFVDFARQVLDDRLPPASADDWDVVGVLLGNLFDGDLDAYTAGLRAALDRVSPRPTIVYTLSEVGEDAVAINEIIRALPRSYPNVVVADWAATTAVDPGQLLVDGGSEPTADGAGQLVLLTAAVLGRFTGPEADAAECLASPFTDDSAIVL